jgi:hypothetical protein
MSACMRLRGIPFRVPLWLVVATLICAASTMSRSRLNVSRPSNAGLWNIESQRSLDIRAPMQILERIGNE